MVRFSILMTTLGLGILQAMPSLAAAGFSELSSSNSSSNRVQIEAVELIARKPDARGRSARKSEETSGSKTRSRRSSPSRSTTPNRRRTTTKVRSTVKSRTSTKRQPKRVSTPIKKTPSKVQSGQRTVRKRPTNASKTRSRRNKVEIKTVMPTTGQRNKRKSVTRHPRVNQRVQVKPQTTVVKKDQKETHKKTNIRRRRPARITVIQSPTVKPNKTIRQVKPTVTRVKPTVTKVKRVHPTPRRQKVRGRSDYSSIRTRTRSRHPLVRRHRGWSNRRLRRVVRRRRAVPYWGTRRVRSRPLTRAYRPCYYCPGQGWSYTSNCNSVARRYYIYSGSYASLLPQFTSVFGRSRSYRDQLLAERVEAAILDYAEQYALDDLEDTLKVTQDGSDIILSGDVDTEEILEDIVAIARDTEGVDDVITDDVVVLYPSEPQDILLDDFDPVLETYEQEEPELIFTAAVDDDAAENFED